jgi:GNAT superfamily N-acetyltransferase
MDASSTDAILRRAGPSDAPAIRALTREAYAKWVPLIGREPMPMVVDYEARVRDHRIDVVEAGDGLAALVELVAAADHLLIENVAVLPAFQGQGYGRRLMAHAEAVAATLGVAEIRLYTNALFAANVQLYRKLGYRLDREEPSKGGFTVFMSKPV